MFTHYVAGEGEKFLWASEDSEVFRKVENLPFYKKYVYLYLSEGEHPPVWLWVAGHEKADPAKSLISRVRQSCLMIHFCVSGRGYYNDQLITPGMMFLSWPTVKHSLVADPNDPFEFYWISLQGDELFSCVEKLDFHPSKLVMPCSYLSAVVPLIDHYINLDHSTVDLSDYTDALLRMIFSFQMRSVKKEKTEEKSADEHNFNKYVESAKQLFHDSNYSMSVQKVAEILRVTPKHFIRVFREETGETPKEYATRKRLELGAAMLKNGMPASEVAITLKYNDYILFYRAFVSKYGISPANYAD